MKNVQAPDGMWRQVLDQPDLWEETSCTAMFAYGIARAVNRGWIDASYLEVARNVLRQELLEANCTVAALYDLLTDCRAKQLEQASWRAKDNLPMDFF